MVHRLVFLGNNALAVRVLRFLKTQPQQLAGLVVHPKGKSKKRLEIVRISKLAKSAIFLGDSINNSQTIKAIRALKPDLLVSVMFGFILKREILGVAKYGAVNLHPAYLPYNRGSHPNVWAIVEETPAGATLHTINEGVDTGKIIAQKRIDILPTDTGKSLYLRLEDLAYELFVDNWQKLTRGKLKLKVQKGSGTFHQVKDLQEIAEIKLNKTYTGKELINLLRARTFPPYQGTFFTINGKRIYLQLKLTKK